MNILLALITNFMFKEALVCEQRIYLPIVNYNTYDALEM